MLEPLRDEYDYVFLDCPPSISLVSESVFEAADALLVPIIPATLSSRTFEQLDAVVADARERTGQVLAFFSMVEVRKKLHREVMDRAAGRAHVTMLGAAIPSSDEVERMGVERDAIAAFAPGGRAALAYEALWRERARAARADSASADDTLRSSRCRPATHRPPPIEADPEDVHRVLLLYSGGLDTSVMLKWIQDEVRGRGRRADRQPRPARRGLRRDPRQGAAARRARVPGRRRARGVRARVRAAGDQGQRDLRPRLSAVHRARPAADRQARGRARARDRLRHDRPRLHRQGQRSGPDRGDDRHARPRAEGDRAGAQLADGPRGGGRLRARARDPGQGRHRGRRRTRSTTTSGAARARAAGSRTSTTPPTTTSSSSSRGPRRRPTRPRS